MVKWLVGQGCEGEESVDVGFSVLPCPSRAILFNYLLSYTDGVMLSQLIVREYGDLGTQVVVSRQIALHTLFYFSFSALLFAQNRFWEITLHVGDHPGHPEAAAIVHAWMQTWNVPFGIRGEKSYDRGTPVTALHPQATQPSSRCLRRRCGRTP